MLQAVHGWSSTYERLVKSQKFFSSYLTQEDLSRLGRNSSLTGLYINFTFPKYNVRYIAINDHFDTIDPNSTDSDIAGIKNWFNEFFAKDTSRKIRAVNKVKGERGVPLTVNVPFGYRKDPEDKTKWIVDEAAALVVKRIFKLCMQSTVTVFWRMQSPQYFSFRRIFMIMFLLKLRFFPGSSIFSACSVCAIILTG